MCCERSSSGFASHVTLVESSEAVAAVDAEAAPIVFVIVRTPEDTTRKHLLQGRAYLSFLQRCSFFLAAPGFRMPLCHNLVEAMSVGAVPIVSYGDWLDPPLRDGVDCLGYSTLQELETTIERALAMPEDEIARLRSGVLAYYAEHLSVESLARRLCPQLDASPTIVVNSEWETVELWLARAPVE
jgi:glycosyltransferase involved in cell wall biosynthesis